MSQQPPQDQSPALAARPAHTPTRQEKKARIKAIEARLTAAANGDATAANGLGSAVAELRTLTREHNADSIIASTFTAAVRYVTSDDVVTAVEEKWLSAFAGTLGLDATRELDRQGALREKFIIAMINDGRPPVLDSHHIILKPGETAYGEFRVSLMKQVTQREWRGGSSGFSVPIGHTGIRYRSGAMHGHSVEVGTELVAEDTGILTVTSARAVYAGTKKTLEFRGDRLVSVEQYRDGLRLGVSNRQATALFKFDGGSPSIAAALLSNASRG